jgi:hypothetical protein
VLDEKSGKRFARVKNRRKRLRNRSLLGESLTRLEQIPAKILGNAVQHGTLIHEELHSELERDDAGQELAGAGVLRQGSLAGTHLRLVFERENLVILMMTFALS